MPVIQADPGVGHNAIAGVVQYYAECIGGLRNQVAELEATCTAQRKGLSDMTTAYDDQCKRIKALANAVDKSKSMPNVQRYEEVSAQIASLINSVKP